MSIGRAYHVCTILEEDNLLIAAGGYTNGWERTKSVEILDLTSETWSGASAMPGTGKTWATGEFLFFWTTEKLYQYEQRSDEWLEIEQVPFDLGELHPRFLAIDASTINFCSYL